MTPHFLSPCTESSELKGSARMRELIILKHQQFLSPVGMISFALWTHAAQKRRNAAISMLSAHKEGNSHNQSHPGIHFGDFIKSLSALNYWIRAQKWDQKGQKGVIWTPHIPCLSESPGQLTIAEEAGEESKIAHCPSTPPLSSLLLDPTLSFYTFLSRRSPQTGALS